MTAVVEKGLAASIAGAPVRSNCNGNDVLGRKRDVELLRVEEVVGERMQRVLNARAIEMGDIEAGGEFDNDIEFTDDCTVALRSVVNDLDGDDQ